MTIQIDQISFLEITDFEFKIQFVYCSKIIQTKSMPRTLTEAEIIDVIKETVRDFNCCYNEQAFNTMVEKYSGQSLVIN